MEFIFSRPGPRETSLRAKLLFNTGNMPRPLLTALLVVGMLAVQAQNPLFIPPVLSGTNFRLTNAQDTAQFFPSVNTLRYGINGKILGPTLLFNKWDWITLNVTNNLPGNGNSTTMHWHGLHVPAMADGGAPPVIRGTH